MIVRNLWIGASIPEHHTSQEILTQPEDAMSISEMFEKAAKGESLNGLYDEFTDDSYFDTSHDPDMQDPLLREAMHLNEIDNIKSATKAVKGIKTKSDRIKADTSDSSLIKQVGTSSELQSGEKTSN